jgi:hypothetical protein
MEEIKATKTKAPAKPRKTAAKKTAAPVVEVAAPTNGAGPVSAVSAPAVSASNVTEMKPSFEQVAQLAHRYWAERGHQHGHHVDDWLRAEQELRGKAS